MSRIAAEIEGVLSEAHVLTKARTIQRHEVTSLNFWGYDLVDISIVRRLPNLQVVSLSMNRISALQDFASCAPILNEICINIFRSIRI